MSEWSLKCQSGPKWENYFCCAEDAAEDNFDAAAQDDVVELGETPDSLPSIIQQMSAFDATNQQKPRQLGRAPACATNVHHAQNAGPSLALSPGDVICVRPREAGAFSQIGASGGFMGHVLLVIAPPKCVERHSKQALQYTDMWPNPDVQIMWAVKTLESTREEEGFHESDQLLFTDPRGQFFTVGEEPMLAERGFYKLEEPEEVQLWLCPENLRKGFSNRVMQDVLAQMRTKEASWSWSTAVRALLLSAEVTHQDHKDQVLQSCKKSWTVDPICTSVVIVFWQRYLCRLADITNARQWAGCEEIDPASWIVDWMPLKGDRTLPGELMTAMQKTGWTIVSHLGARSV